MHIIDYFVTGKKNRIMDIAEDFAYEETDWEDRSYHGGMTIHDNIICDSYEEAKDKIKELDKGFYDDHAVQYKDENGKIKWLVKVEVHC